jgi:hypothetical protein
MDLSITQYRIYCFVKDGLVKSTATGFNEWADANVSQLARIYQDYRGVAFSLVDATHVLYFMQTVCVMSNLEDTMDMTSHFIRCQFKDSVV